MKRSTIYSFGFVVLAMTYLPATAAAKTCIRDIVAGEAAPSAMIKHGHCNERTAPDRKVVRSVRAALQRSRLDSAQHAAPDAPVYKLLNAATDALNAGRNKQVISVMYDVFGPQINAWALNTQYTSTMQREVLLLVTLAVLRSEGTIERTSDPTLLGGKHQRDNVRWAVRAMEGLAFVDFAPQRHVAEAWGRDPGLREAALDKLEALDKQGRLISPFQKSLLQRLREIVTT